MSFLDGTTVTKPAGSPSGGFLDSAHMLPHASMFVAAQQDAAQSEQDSKKANSFGTIAMETLKGMNPATEQARNAAANNPVSKFVSNTAKNTWAIYQATPYKLIDDIKGGASDIQQGGVSDIYGIPIYSKDKGKIKVAFRTMGDVANSIFAPLSAAIGSVLEQSGGQKLQDQTGQTIADKSGITDMPAFQRFATQHPNFGEDFTRLLTLFMSKADSGAEINPKEMLGEIHKTATGLVEKATKSPEVVRQLQMKSEGAPETKIPIQTPKTKQADYAKSQGYEQYTPADQLPVIDAGKLPNDALPVIQAGESIRITKNSKGDFVYEAIKDPVQSAPVEPVKPAPVRTIDEQPTPTKPVDYTKETNGQGQPVSKTVSDLANKIGVDSQDLPTYAQMDLAKIASEVETMYKNDQQRAIRIAMGDEPAPTGSYPENYFTGVRELALKNGDFETLRQLTNTKIAAVAAQRLRALGGQDITGYDPVKAMQEIKSVREKKVSSTSRKSIDALKSEAEQQITSEIRKQAPSKQTWKDFVEQIKCGY
jgi:hypothetical protein